MAAGVLRAAARRGLGVPEPTEFEVYPGEGVVASVDGERVLCGTERLMARAHVEVPEGVRARVQALAAEGRSVVLVAKGGHVIGLIALGDTLRPEVPEALAALRALGVQRVLLLTGDRHEVATALARQLGLEVRAELLPEQKIRVVEELQRAGHIVAMVGDGINDAPALAQADVGIAMGAAGTDAAIEAAHVALMRDDWRAVPEAIRLGRRAFRTIQQNLWFTPPTTWSDRAGGLGMAAARRRRGGAVLTRRRGDAQCLAPREEVALRRVRGRAPAPTPRPVGFATPRRPHRRSSA